MTREQFEEALKSELLEFLRVQVMSFVGGDMADDAVQDALEDFPYQNFNIAGPATLLTFLTTRVRQRAFNLLNQERRFYIYSFQDSDETGVPPYDLWEDVNTETGEAYLEGDFKKKMGPRFKKKKGPPPGEEEPDDSSDDEETAGLDDQDVDENEREDELFDHELPIDLDHPVIEIPSDVEPVFVDMLRRGEELLRYHDAHPWARREDLKDTRPLTANEREELVSQGVERVVQDLLLQHQQNVTETGTEMKWYSRLPHTDVVRHLKMSYPGPLTPHPQGRKVLPPGVKNNFCDLLHHHKYGYLPLRLLSCQVCLPVDKIQILPSRSFRNLQYTHTPSEPPLGFPPTPSRSQGRSRKVWIWPREIYSTKPPQMLIYGYNKRQVRRFHPSLDPDCPTAWGLIRNFLHGPSGLRLHGIAGRTRQPTQRTTQSSPLDASTETTWIGGDPITHALYSRYVGHLTTESRALLWLADENFDQEYTQEEIARGCDLSESTVMAADQVNDPYAQALAQFFRGVERSTLSRKHKAIREWFRTLQTDQRVSPTWRPPTPPTDFLVPADETCRHCGGLLLTVWVDPLRVRLLPVAPAGTDAAYLAKRCVNCGDRIDSLTLRRRGKAYDKRADAFLRGTYTPEEIRDLVEHYGKHPPVVFRKLSRQCTTPLPHDSKLPPKSWYERWR